MTCLRRNMRDFYFANQLGIEEITDEYGNAKGEYMPIYGKPMLKRANISPATGEVATEIFGGDETYDKVIVTNDASSIDEYSILWIDTTPKFNRDGTTNTPHDYEVTKVARSLNSTSIAVSKVNVRE